MIDVRRFAGAGLETGRAPVLAGSAMVVAPDRTAALAGLAVLREGGNAVDAALAVCAMLVVAQPHQCGLGGDAFWLIRRGDETLALTASGRSAAAASAAGLRERGLHAIPPRSGLAVTVPGVVSGWAEAHARFGTVELSRLVEPAADAAERGLPVSPLTASSMGGSEPMLSARAESTRVFLPRGRVPAVGERLPLPDLARTLGLLARDPGAFYRGELAERVSAAVRAEGGLLEPADLEAQRADWSAPVTGRFAGWLLAEAPPSSQGVIALLAMRLLEESGTEPGSAERLRAAVEAARAAMAVRDAELGDADHMRLSAEEVVAASPAVGSGAPAPPARGDTVHLAVVDADGLAVSCIQSVFQDFGSGIVVPGTGIVLHNRGAGFRLDDDAHPNSLGPSKRPMHTLAPALATAGGRTAAVFGAMGGHAQAQIQLQLAEALAAEGLDPATATGRPRWFVPPGEETVLAEDRDGLPERLEAVGRQVARVGPYEQTMGHAQVILVDHERGVLAGAADPRSDGLAAGL